MVFYDDGCRRSIAEDVVIAGVEASSNSTAGNLTQGFGGGRQW